MHVNDKTQILKERACAVKSKAAAHGFDVCGIASAGPIDEEDRLGQWLANGCHADMDWMATTKELRQDVRKKLPNARSVIVVAKNYYSERPNHKPDTGCVSRYAWGRDYHNVLKKPIRRLATFISSLESGSESYCCIDTGPVLERAWAERSGVAWTGKNSLSIRRDLGSWFFLGVIISSVELFPDTPARNYCGSCTRCIDACPTSAITEPYNVDSRRCISYHTIENRGEVPQELADSFGNMVFGCDVCQEACPWNRFAKETNEDDFKPRKGISNPDLSVLENMDEDTFNKTFEGSPIRRTRLSGIQRNAKIAHKKSCH